MTVQFPESLDSPLTFPRAFGEVRAARGLDPVSRCVLLVSYVLPQ